MSDSRSDDPAEETWPDSYEAPTLEPLGSVWDRTGGLVGTASDGTLLMTE
jgi:hypothetical protein